MYVDNYLQITVHHDSNDLTALKAFTSLASDDLHHFGPWLTGEIPVLAPRKSSHRDVELERLCWKLNTHIGRISLLTAKIACVLDTLERY